MDTKPTAKKSKASLDSSPLQLLRSLLGWTREECSRHTGSSVASLQNYERGFAPLPKELALALESVCGVNSADFLEKSRVWLESGGVEKCKQLTSMGGRPYTAETFANYQKVSITETVRDSAIEDVQRRCRLILGPLSAKPHLFRTAYRKLAQTLEELRARMEISEADMADFASQGAEVAEFEWTLGEVAAEPDISESPRWVAAKVMERFGILEKARVRQEKFSFWPITLPDILDSGKEMVPDCQLGQRIVWRITLPDKSQIVLPVDKFETSGLVRTVGNTLATPPLAAGHPTGEAHSQVTRFRKGRGPEKPPKPSVKSRASGGKR